MHVYKVICFARKHKHPVRRSAFTYCEDELPSRMDMGKNKYGGPFTTEEVENVKVFLGILQVLMSLGPLFAVERSVSAVLPLISIHLSGSYYSSCILSFLSKDALPLLLVCVLFIIYIMLLRPLIYNYIPGILKRIGLGMIFLVIPILCFLILDSVGHTGTSHSTECVLTMQYNLFTGDDNAPLGINSLILLFPHFSKAIGSVIFYTAIYEFICAQSPHSMKGFLIGAYYDDDYGSLDVKTVNN